MTQGNNLKQGNNTHFRRIVVSEHNYRKLKEQGLAGDSFNDVITEMLKKSE